MIDFTNGITKPAKMNHFLACLLVLFFSLSSPAREENGHFWQSSIAAETVSELIAHPFSVGGTHIAAIWRSRGIDPGGFYNLGARYYDPVAGHFLSPDPLGYEASMDLHSFCLGDPINRFDPTGRFGKEAFNGAQAGMADAGENGISSFNGFGSSSNMKGIYAFEDDFEQGEKDVLFACNVATNGMTNVTR
jgi:RHS repeat-associated protein